MGEKCLPNSIVMNLNDNVATVLDKVEAGNDVAILDPDMKRTSTVRSICDIPFGHKISLEKIKKNGNIIKYGEVIGRATKEIEIGDYVHIHNVISIEGSKKVVEQ